ncbi:MAG: LLM class flavin-dependent oxidoreductase, partial [Candidatus Kariarchaeaceae archaeon]
GREPYVEAWTAMTGIGMQTKQLRVGQIVLFNSLRNPAFLAKSIATLDNMTNGRYELLIGSGWNEPEYKGYDLMEGGRGMPSAKERVDRFEESLKILNLMLSQEETSYDGDFWKLDQAFNVPQPVQKPMRISVGCKGPRMMRITAKYAQGWNIGARSMKAVRENFDKFEKIVEKHTDNKFSDYYISGFGGITVIDDDAKLRESVAQRAEQMKTDSETVLRDQFIGSTENIREKIRQLKEWGMDMCVMSISVDGNDDPLGHFKSEILNRI